MTLAWLAIILLLVVIEVSTVQLTTVWFVVSGIISMILSIFINSIEIQFAIFVIGGIVLLFTTRPYLMKKLKVKESRTNLDRVVGMNGIVTQDIDKLKPGEVKVDGKMWTAISDKEIKKGKVVEILKIEGVKLKVKEIDYCLLF